MPERRSGWPTAPTELRTRHQSVEIPQVQLFEKLFEIVNVATRIQNVFAPTLAAEPLQLLPDILAIQVQSISRVIRTRYRTSVELTNQNKCKRLDDGRRRIPKDVR